MPRVVAGAVGAAVVGHPVVGEPALSTATESGDSATVTFAGATSIAIWAAVAVLVVGRPLAWPLDRTARRT